MVTNTLAAVATLQESMLSSLFNQNCFINTANKKFKDFENLVGNLGATVNLKLPTRYTSNPSLTATFQGTVDRFTPLSVTQAESIGLSFTSPEIIFNADKFMDEYGMSAVAQIGARVEAQVASEVCLAPYRFYYSGITANTIDPVNSFGQLAIALQNMRAYGAAPTDFVGYLDNVQAASIVNSGLAQFVPRRNDDMANSWELGDFSGCRWCTSNVLPTHTAGTAGTNGDTLTFSSISADGTQVTFTGVSVDAGAIAANDLIEFQTGVRYRTFVGQTTTSQRVQVRATAAANASGGTVTVNITPALISDSTSPAWNLSRALTGADTALVMPSHRRGMITSGKSLYLAMPMLPDQEPFPTAHKNDPETGVALRVTKGAVYGGNAQGMVVDTIWRGLQIPEYAISVLFPL